MKRRSIELLSFVACAGALAAACGAGGGSGGSGSGGGGPGSGGSSGNTGGSGAIVVTGGDAGTGGLIMPGNGGGGGENPDVCASSVYQGEEVPLDMYIMMDKSGSMSADTTTPGLTVWDAIKQAITEFLQSPESDGIGVGIQFFPPGGAGGLPCNPFTPPPCPPGCMLFGPFCVPNAGGSCDLNDYLPPAVGIQLLPGVAQQIIDAMNMQAPGGGTPTLPAMQSAAMATSTYAQQNPARKVIIVLATDGNPNDCNSTIPGVAAEAANALANTPEVATFVIGIGNIAGLDQVAMAGGTDKALEVDPATAGQDFLDAMNEIRGKALRCDFTIDQTSPEGEPVDFGKVNVLFTPPGGSPETVYNVPDASACDPVKGGWYYDNPTMPKQIKTCPATCDRLTVEQGTVQIQLGCKTKVF